ncbi:hypothetical protein JCM10908_003346 [Rhodotorula pacifica]|uniref:ATP19 family protein n=1 Tax=Rhodotorula pacifica TaxID=1495444 RepID=UPI00316BED56
MSYTILGRKVANEYIALSVYGLTGLGAWAAMRGGSDKKVDAKVEPKATATSDEEAAFLQNFINDRESSFLLQVALVASRRSRLLTRSVCFLHTVEHKEKAQAGH